MLTSCFPEHHLYTLISKHLQANPTTTKTASMVRVPGVPPPNLEKEYPTPAIPKGWKMGTILPHYSPGLTGGGVSENFMKDMMAELQNSGGGAGMPGMPDMSALQNMMGAGGGAGMGRGASGQGSGGEGKAKKKEKKKIKG